MGNGCGAQSKNNASKANNSTQPVKIDQSKDFSTSVEQKETITGQEITPKLQLQQDVQEALINKYRADNPIKELTLEDFLQDSGIQPIRLTYDQTKPNDLEQIRSTNVPNSYTIMHKSKNLQGVKPVTNPEDALFDNQMNEFLEANDPENVPLQIQIHEIKTEGALIHQQQQQDQEEQDIIKDLEPALVVKIQDFTLQELLLFSESLKVFRCSINSDKNTTSDVLLRYYESPLNKWDQNKAAKAHEVKGNTPYLRVLRYGLFTQPGLLNNFVIFTELPHCTLDSAIIYLANSNTTMTESDATSVLLQLIKIFTTNKMYSNVRYISPSQIYIKPDKKSICIGDFDSVHFLEQLTNSINCSDLNSLNQNILDPPRLEALTFSAPEILQNGNSSPVYDPTQSNKHLVYSIGTIMLKFVLLHKEFSFKQKNEHFAMLKIIRDKSMNALADLIQAMVAGNPAERPNLWEIQHTIERNKLVLSPLFPFKIENPGPLEIPKDRSNLLKINISKGKIYHIFSQYKQALVEYKKAEGVISSKNDLINEEKIHLTKCYHYMGICYQNLKQPMLAVSYFEKALELKSKLFGTDDPSYVGTLHNLALLYKESGNLEKASQAANHCVEVLGRVHGDSHPAYITAFNNNIGILVLLRDFSNAIRICHSSINSYKKMDEQQSINYAQALSTLAFVYNEEMNYEESLQVITEARSIYEATGMTKDPEYLKVLNRMAQAYKGMEDASKATEIYEFALHLSLKEFLEDSDEHLYMLETLAEHYRDVLNFDKAITSYEKALLLRQKKDNFTSADNVVLLNKISSLYQNSNQHQKALEFQHKIKDIKKVDFGEESLSYALTLQSIGMIHESLKQWDQALQAHLQCLSIKKQVLGANHNDCYKTLENIVRVYRAIGNTQKVDEYSALIKKGKHSSLQSRPSFRESQRL